MPSLKARRSASDERHPRLWLNPDTLASLAAAVQADATRVGWDVFYDKSVLHWMDRPLIAKPKAYPDNIRVATLWRQMYRLPGNHLYHPAPSDCRQGVLVLP